VKKSFSGSIFVQNFGPYYKNGVIVLIRPIKSAYQGFENGDVSKNVICANNGNRSTITKFGEKICWLPIRYSAMTQIRRYQAGDPKTHLPFITAN